MNAVRMYIRKLQLYILLNILDYFKLLRRKRKMSINNESGEVRLKRRSVVSSQVRIETGKYDLLKLKNNE